jgi:hypothetical protein
MSGPGETIDNRCLQLAGIIIWSMTQVQKIAGTANVSPVPVTVRRRHAPPTPITFLRTKGSVFIPGTELHLPKEASCS